MTISSLGGIGGSFFTPIINFPEVAILGVGRAETKQIYFDEKFQKGLYYRYPYHMIIEL